MSISAAAGTRSTPLDSIMLHATAEVGVGGPPEAATLFVHSQYIVGAHGCLPDVGLGRIL